MGIDKVIPVIFLLTLPGIPNAVLWLLIITLALCVLTADEIKNGMLATTATAPMPPITTPVNASSKEEVLVSPINKPVAKSAVPLPRQIQAVVF